MKWMMKWTCWLTYFIFIVICTQVTLPVCINMPYSCNILLSNNDLNTVTVLVVFLTWPGLGLGYHLGYHRFVYSFNCYCYCGLYDCALLQLVSVLLWSNLVPILVESYTSLSNFFANNCIDCTSHIKVRNAQIFTWKVKYPFSAMINRVQIKNLLENHLQYMQHIV